MTKSLLDGLTPDQRTNLIENSANVVGIDAFKKAKLDRVGRFVSGYKTLSDVIANSVQWRIENVLAKGHISLLAADAGVGKSQLAISLAAWLTKRGTGVAYWSPEVDFGLQMKEQFTAQGGDESIMYVNPNIETLPFLADNLDTVLYGRDVLIIDTFADYSGATNTWAENEVTRMLLPMRQAILDTEKSVLVIGHFKKGTHDQKQHKISGSTQIQAQFAQILGLYRYDQGKPTHLYAEVIKSNIGPVGKCLNCQLDPLGADKAVMVFPSGGPEIGWNYHVSDGGN